MFDEYMRCVRYHPNQARCPHIRNSTVTYLKLFIFILNSLSTIDGNSQTYTSTGPFVSHQNFVHVPIQYRPVTFDNKSGIIIYHLSSQCNTILTESQVHHMILLNGKLNSFLIWRNSEFSTLFSQDYKFSFLHNLT